jgi:hypothetical protein
MTLCGHQTNVEQALDKNIKTFVWGGSAGVRTFELWSSGLLGKNSTTWATPLASIFSSFWQTNKETW